VYAAAAFLAWLGASVVVLADGRRGLALGLALLTAGLAVLAWPSGAWLGSSAVGAGGLIASWQCWRSGPAPWGIMPAGSTARLVLCVGSGLLALWIAASVTNGPGAPLRFAVLVLLVLMGARILGDRETAVLLTSVAGLALVLAVAPGLAATSQGFVPATAGGLVAAGVMFLPSGRAKPVPPGRAAHADKDGA
jgi:hypothetical protein